MCMYVCVPYLRLVLSEPLKLELEVVVSHHLVLLFPGTMFPGRAAIALNC